jgi:hypothetical protein
VVDVGHVIPSTSGRRHLLCYEDDEKSGRVVMEMQRSHRPR